MKHQNLYFNLCLGKSTRLGLRFENLLWFWLQEDQYHPYQLLGHSIQKIDGAKL